MGDYLKLVADRSQGKPVAVQPRVPSLFEPPPAAVSARLRPFQTFTYKSGPDRPAEYLGPRVPMTAEAQAEASPVTGNRREEPSSAAEITNQSKRPSVKVDNEPSPAEIRRPIAQPLDTAITREVERVITRAQEPVSLQSRPKAAGQLEDDAGENAGRPVSQSKRQKASQQEKPVNQEERFNVSSRKLEKPVQPKQEFIHRPAPQPVAPLALNQQAQRSVSLVAEPIEDSRPVINVVIGRVSVNAVTERAPLPVRVPQPSAPTLSLDQYLKQREGRS